MPSYKKNPDRPDPRPKQNDVVERFAREALEAFREEMPEAHAELTKTYEGSSVVAGVFGLGMVHVSVDGGQVHVNATPNAKSRLVARGATYPEVIAAVATGKITVLEAFHKGDIAVQAPRSSTLHDGYSHMVKFSDAALRSQRLQKVFQEFCKATGIDA